MPDRPHETGLRRAELYRGRLIDDQLRTAGTRARISIWLRARFTSERQRSELELDRRLRELGRSLSRTNHIAVVSPKGGVGKTTCTFLVGDALARYLRLRVVAVDANPDYGTLGSLAPDRLRSDRSLADLLPRIDELTAPGELRPYIAPLESGLHLLAAPAQAEVMATVGPEHYERLIAFLGRFYELIVLDLGTGLTDPLARYALTVADQTLVVSTPEWVTADRVLAALRDLEGTLAAGRVTAVLNQAPPAAAIDRQLIEAAFRRAELASPVTVPHDPRLREALDAGAYQLDTLPRPTRIAVKQLAHTIAQGLQ